MRNRHLPLALAALTLTACIPVPVPAGGGSTPPPGQPAAQGQAGLPTKLQFTGGVQSLGTAETRGLAAMLTDDRGQIVAWPLTWSSTAPAVAFVDAQGVVKGLTRGSATIVAALQANPAVRAEIRVEVGANRSSLGVRITPESPVVVIGEAPIQLRGEVTLADGQVNANVLWTSSDNTIAEVNPSTGQVNGFKVGEVTIVGAYAQDPSIRATAFVKVVKDRAAVPSAQPSAVIFRPGTDSGDAAAEFNGVDGWTRDVIADPGAVHAIAFGDRNAAFASGSRGELYTSIDGGAGWQKINPVGLVGTGLSAMDFIDHQTGWGVINADIYKTTDAGLTWTKLATMETPQRTRYDLHHVDFLDAQTGFAGGGGAVFKTTDGGANWGQVATPPDLAFDAYQVGGTKVFLMGGQEVYAFGGGAWSPTTLLLGPSVWPGPTKTGMVSFVSATEGWAVGSTGGQPLLQKTADGGKTWAPVALTLAPGSATPPPGAGASGLPPSVCFADAMHGVLVDGSTAWTTSDGGRSWLRKHLTNSNATRVRATGPDHFYVLAHAGAPGVSAALCLQYDGR